MVSVKREREADFEDDDDDDGSLLDTTLCYASEM